MIFSNQTTDITAIHQFRYRPNVLSNVKTAAARCKQKSHIENTKTIGEDNCGKIRNLYPKAWERSEQRLELLVISDPLLVKILEMNESLLNIQKALLEKLTVDENHIKNLAVMPGLKVRNFQHGINDTQEILKSMHG